MLLLCSHEMQSVHITHVSTSAGTAGISNICLALLRSAPASSQANELPVLLSKMQECHLPVGPTSFTQSNEDQTKYSQIREIRPVCYKLFSFLWPPGSPTQVECSCQHSETSLGFRRPRSLLIFGPDGKCCCSPHERAAFTPCL